MSNRRRSIHRLRDFGNRGGRLVADLVSTCFEPRLYKQNQWVMDGFGTVAPSPSPSRPQATLAPKAQNPPVGRSLACHDFANGEQMSRLSSALGA
jgi:hypothetical protein